MTLLITLVFITQPPQHSSSHQRDYNNCHVEETAITPHLRTRSAWPWTGMTSSQHTTPHHKNVSLRGITLCSIHQALSHMLCYPLLLFPASSLTPSSPAERLYRCKHLVTVYARTPQHLFFFKCFKLGQGLGVIGPYPFPPMYSVSGVFFLCQHNLKGMCETDRH